jgi:transposase
VFVDPRAESVSLAHDEVGIIEVMHRLATKPQLIVLEATGGLEVDLATRLMVAGLPVVVVNPVKSGTTPRPRASWPRRIGSTP